MLESQYVALGNGADSDHAEFIPGKVRDQFAESFWKLPEVSYCADEFFAARSAVFIQQVFIQSKSFLENEVIDVLQKMTANQGKGTKCPHTNSLNEEMQGQVMEWRPRCDVQCVDDKKNGPVFLEANFLSPNTDLNLPPSNWLRSSSQVERYIRDCRLGWKQPQAEFSSFSMGNEFPEFIGEVDVISDAENIKKLLKIPYNKAHVSMMVHRIRKTLLLDDFDIHKHLLRQQQEDWEWMRKFYQETVMRNREEKMKCVPKKNKSRDHLQNRNLYSKFLYYSVSDTDSSGGVSGEGVERGQSTSEENSGTETSNLQIIPDSLQQSGDTGFHREVLWTFEDIQMLIGTDLPIFRAGHHPCVSVRLRDMSKPVNVLTGMDYWLDNLMCNVPELAMCYHLNGIVQNYELIKTAEIPNLDDSKFSPQEVTDIAKNILSFLKSNATKEGHTYWLYKGVDDDVVKLYDLTTLCADNMENKTENPFTVPLGMLLYRVARNLRKSTMRKHASTIRTLLNTCVMLLDQDKHAQVYTSAHYLLADLYVPDSVVSDVWGLSSNSEESDSECEDTEQEDEKTESSKSVKVQSLSQPEQSEEKKRTAVVKYSNAVFSTAEEKCRESIKCIYKGLTCLNKHMSVCMNSSQEETQATCNPDEAIPLFYEPLNPSSARSDSASPDLSPSGLSPPHNTEHSLRTFSAGSPTGTSPERWHLLSKVLLYRKSAMAYYSLATIMMESQKYGATLKYIKLAILCFSAMKSLSPTKAEDNKWLMCVILSTVADARLMIAHNNANMESFQHDFQTYSDTDAHILEAAQEDLLQFDKEWMYSLTDNIETNLRCCGVCYDEARQIAQSEKKTDQAMLHSLAKRFGNAMNELGVLHMNKALAVVTGTVDWKPLEEQEIEWKLSYSCFDQGVQAFESIGDVANQALLLSNIGQLMRICAQSNTVAASGQSKREFSPGERHYYTKAITFYQKALTSLAQRSKFPQIWDSVNWELSTTYFNMAMLLQDHAPLSAVSLEEVEKEITDLMTKALRHCDVEKNTCRALGYQYRAGTINHRLASLHHNSYRNQGHSDQKRKYIKQLAFSHYEKAAQFFGLTESFNDLLRVHLEQVALCEFCLEETAGSGVKCKTLEDTLRYLLLCKTAVTGLCQQCKEKDTTESTDTSEWHRLLDIFKSRLLHILLSLMKHYSKLRKGKDSENDKVQRLKTMYSSALQGLASEDNPITQKCDSTVQVLSQLEHIWWTGDKG